MGTSIASVIAAGLAAWPTIAVDPEELADHVERIERDGTLITPEYHSDVYLACACALAIPAATRALEEILKRDTTRMITRIDASPAFVDEALQLLRMKLLTDDPPKIADYAGRSALARWIGTAAVRTALNLKRGRVDVSDNSLESKIGEDVARGPELALAAERYKGTFEDGLRMAVAQLTDRERALLRMNLVEQMGVDKLARVYGCGRSTVARWLQGARAKLFEVLQGHVRATHGLTETEAASLAVVVRGDLDVSIARLLGDDAK